MVGVRPKAWLSLTGRILHMTPQVETSGTIVPFAYCTKQAARLLQVSHRTLEDWRLRGGGPRFSKIGRSVRYRRIDLEEFLRQHSFENTAQARLAA